MVIAPIFNPLSHATGGFVIISRWQAFSIQPGRSQPFYMSHD